MYIRLISHLIEEDGAILACSTHKLINTARMKFHVGGQIVHLSCKYNTVT